MKKKVVHVDGGMGRVLCAEPAIRRLTEAGNEVCVVTSWPEVLAHHPNVKVYHMHHQNLWEDIIQDGEYIAPEPYNNIFYYQKKHHMTQSFDYLINGSVGSELTPIVPKIFLSDEEIVEAKKVLSDMINQYGHAAFTLVIQPFGSGAGVYNSNFSLDMPREERTLESEKYKAARANAKMCLADYSNRSMSFEMVGAIMNQLHPDFMILNFSTIEVSHPRVLNYQGSLRQWFAIMSMADYFIGIDSIGQHVAAAFDIPGHVFFGGTAVENLAYPEIHSIVQREGYPKAYVPYRQDFSHAINDKAMEFDEKTIASVCKEINEKFFG